MPDLSALRGYRLIFYTYAQEFSMIINEAMRQLLLREQPEGRGWPHDGWTIWNAYYRGKILHDTRILAYYRRHDKTVTNSGKNRASQIASWMTNEIFGGENRQLCQRAAEFVQANADVMSRSDKQEWILLSNKTTGLLPYFKRLFFPHRLRPSAGGEIALRILFLLN
jgi:hypothetical protein